MTIPTFPSLPAYAPPTTVLPSVKAISSLSLGEFSQLLDYLRLLYIPNVHGSRRIHPKPMKLRSGASSALDAIRNDPFERTHALRWLTASLSRFSNDNPMADALLMSAASLLAVCAGAAGAGALTRRFAFGSVSVQLMDAALENADFGSVGVQTWGSASVLAEMMADDLMTFLPPDMASGQPLRVLELGAGTGLVSLTLGKLQPTAMTVVATDNHPLALDNLRANVAANFNSDSVLPPVSVIQLDWTEVYAAAAADRPSELPLDPALHAPFDMLVGADIVYATDHAKWLRACAAHFLRPGGRFHLILPLRDGYRREAASVEEVFVEGNDAPCIIRKQTIVCEGSPKGLGRPTEDVEYWHYTLGWAE